MNRVCCICNESLPDDEKHYAFHANLCTPVKKKNGKFLVSKRDVYGRFCISCFDKLSGIYHTEEAADGNNIGT